MKKQEGSQTTPVTHALEMDPPPPAVAEAAAANAPAQQEIFVRSVRLSAYSSVALQWCSFALMLLLQQKLDGDDELPWAVVVAPIWAATVLTALPHYKAAKLMRQWAASVVPPGTALSETQRLQLAARLATTSTQLAQAFNRALFCYLFVLRMGPNPGMDPRVLFMPFYLSFFITAVTLHWEHAHLPAAPDAGPAELDFCKVLNFTLQQNFSVIIFALPVQSQLAGSDNSWAVAFLGPWFTLAIFDLVVAAALIAGIVIMLRLACTEHSRSEGCLAFLFGCFGALVFAPITMALAFTAKKLDGDASITTDMIMTPALIGYGVLAVIGGPAGAAATIKNARDAMERQDAQTQSLAQLLAGAGAGGANNRNRITEFSGDASTHLRRMGSSLFTVVSGRNGDSERVGNENLIDHEQGGEGGAVGAADVVIDVDGGAGADAGATCVVCFDKPRNAVLTPCGHADLCMDCAREIASRQALCPVCRTKIESAHRFGEQRTMPDGSIVMTTRGGFKVS